MAQTKHHAHSSGLKMQILMWFILKVCISHAVTASITDIFRLIKCHQLPMVRVNNSMKKERLHFLFHSSNHTHYVYQVWKPVQDSWTSLRTVNWWIWLSKTPPLMWFCGFPEESLIYCWFGLLLCSVPVSEQCVKTGYLPRLLGDYWVGSNRPGQTPCYLTANLFSVCLSFRFALYLSFLIPTVLFFYTFFSISFLISHLCSPLPSLCFPLFQHNACLWKEGEACFISLSPPPLLSFVSYKRTVDT